MLNVHEDLFVAPFIGRTQELARFDRWLDEAPQGQRRCLTLCGLPGVGKTTLAYAMLQRAQSIQGLSVCWVSAAGLSELKPLCMALLEPLGLALAAGVDVSQDELIVRICHGIERAATPWLIFIDEVDRVCAPTAALFAQVFSRLPQSAQVRFVVTSRSHLEIAQETLLEVGLLPIPAPKASPQEILACDAVQHLLSKLRQDQHAAITQQETCTLQLQALIQRLEGLPLALALAAPWLELLSLEELVARADYVSQLPSGPAGPAKTLSQAIALSWELLSPELQITFTTLCLFDVPLPTRFIEALFDEPWRALVALRALKHKSLIQAVTSGSDSATAWSVPRFIREHVRAQVEITASVNAALCQLSKRFERQREALRLGHPREEILALERSAQALLGLAKLALAVELEPRSIEALSQTLLLLTEVAGPNPALVDATSSLEALMARYPAHHARWRWYLGLARQAHAQQRFEQALHFHALAEDVAEEAPSVELAQALLERANTYYYLGRIDALEQDLDLVQARLDALPEERCWVELTSLWDLRAKIQHVKGDRLGALAHFERALSLARRAQNHYMIARIIQNMAVMHGDCSDFARAHEAFEQALALQHELGDWMRLAHGLNSFGVLLMRQRYFTQAFEVFERSKQAFERCGISSTLPMILSNEAMMMLELEDYEGAFDRAHAAYQASVGCDDDYLSGSATLTYAYTHWFLGEPQKAKLLLEERERSVDWSAHWQLGVCYYSALGALYALFEDFENAQRAFEEARLANANGEDEILDDLRLLHRQHLSVAKASIAERAQDEATSAKLCLEVLNVLVELKRHQRHELSEPLRYATILLIASMPQWVGALWSLERQDPTNQALLIFGHGQLIRAPQLGWVDLRKSPALSQVLMALVCGRLETPGQGLTIPSLIARAWPGELIEPEAAQNRLHVNFSKLRKLGLQRALLRTEQGDYMLDPELTCIQDGA